MKRLLCALLALALALGLAGCVSVPAARTPAPAQSGGLTIVTNPPAATPEATEAPASAQTPAPAAETPASLDPDGRYYDVESVVLYLAQYGALPGNFITKKQAQDLGWTGGSVEKFREGAAIGGDRFGNREGLLPAAPGRSYTECDIDTLGASGRGAKRLVFSSDGLYFYTEDHYEHFDELIVTADGQVEWK